VAGGQNPPSRPYSETDASQPAPIKFARSDPKMHQTSSRLLRMTDDDRPYTRVGLSLFPFYTCLSYCSSAYAQIPCFPCLLHNGLHLSGTWQGGETMSMATQTYFSWRHRLTHLPTGL
jgi:hypothetical protein